MWLDKVKQEYGDNLEITWKNFQLEQVNSKESPEWKVWEQPDKNRCRSLLAAIAGEAARRQGREAFHRFHMALLIARHGGHGRVALNEEKPMIGVAQKAGLDVERFKEDLSDCSLLERIASDHTEAAEHHGVFGTPTFLFESGNTAYLKTFIPPQDKSADLFRHFVALMADSLFLGEIKRPQPPWPTGVIRS